MMHVDLSHTPGLLYAVAYWPHKDSHKDLNRDLNRDLSRVLSRDASTS